MKDAAKTDEEKTKKPAKLQSKIGKPPSVNADGTVKKKRRFRSGVQALRHINRLQKGTENLIRKLPFNRFVREVAQSIPFNVQGCDTPRWQAEAIEALQQASEAYMIAVMTSSYAQTIFRGRQTLAPKDIKMALQQACSGIAIKSERTGNASGV